MCYIMAGMTRKGVWGGASRRERCAFGEGARERDRGEARIVAREHAGAHAHLIHDGDTTGRGARGTTAARGTTRFSFPRPGHRPP